MKISFNPLISNNHQAIQNKAYKSDSPNNYMNRQSALECLANYNISFCRREVIVVHYDGSYERFPSATAAEKKYGSGLRSVLSGAGYASGEVTCVYADECTMEDDKISPVCLKRILNNFSYASKRPIYAIDFYGNIQRFENKGDASEKLGISDATIYNILNDSTRAGDYIFVRAADVEKRDENFRLLYEDEGKPKIDIEAINQARTVFLCLSKKYPIVTIDVDGNTRIYKDTEAMAKDLQNCANLSAQLDVKMDSLRKRVEQEDKL